MVGLGLNGESQNPETVTIKKLCDGFEITLGEKLPVPIHGFNEVKADLEWRIAGAGLPEGTGTAPRG